MVTISECCFSIKKEAKLYKTVWLLTEECPWRCSYCAVAGRRRKSYQPLSLDENILILQKLQKLGIDNLVLTGGEPLLLRDELITLIDQACKMGMSFSMSTTGKPRDIFLNIIERKPRKINFSLDAYDPKIHEEGRNPGSFRYALEIFEILQERNIPININCVLTRFNYKNIRPLLEFIKNNHYNVTGLSIQNQYPVGKGEVDYPLISLELMHVIQNLDSYPLEGIPITLVNAPDISYPLQKCPAGQILFSVFPDGTYTPCSFLLEISDEFALGNILTDSLDSVCHRLKEFASNMNSKLKDISFSTRACLECPNFSTCGLGCYIIKIVHELVYKRPTLRCKRIIENQIQSELSMEEELQIREFVKGELVKSDIAHRFDHIENVVAHAKFIGREEGANLHVVVPAAYFHDITPRENIDSLYEHVEKSKEKAKKYLKKNLNFAAPEIDKITHAIICSAWESHLRGIEPETLEAKVVRDADWLDAIGARGIARVFGFAGYCKLVLC